MPEIVASLGPDQTNQICSNFEDFFATKKQPKSHRTILGPGVPHSEGLSKPRAKPWPVASGPDRLDDETILVSSQTTFFA